MKVNNGFDFDDIRHIALCHYIDAPKAMTLMQHTMLIDTTEVFCVDENKSKVQIFVPKQKLYPIKSRQGGSFLFLKISLVEGTEANYWLVVYSEHRQGFLFPINFFEFNENTITTDEIINQYQ